MDRLESKQTTRREYVRVGFGPDEMPVKADALILSGDLLLSHHVLSVIV